MAVTIDDFVEAATNGVIRALDARRAGQEGASTRLSTESLVRSGFVVDIHIRAGGIPGGPPIEQLNPQPLPP